MNAARAPDPLSTSGNDYDGNAASLDGLNSAIHTETIADGPSTIPIILNLAEVASNLRDHF